MQLEEQFGWLLVDKCSCKGDHIQSKFCVWHMSVARGAGPDNGIRGSAGNTTKTKAIARGFCKMECIGDHSLINTALWQCVEKSAMMGMC